MPTATTTCDYGSPVEGYGFATSTCVTTSPYLYTGLNSAETLLVAMVLLFFVAYQTWDRLFRPGAAWHEDEDNDRPRI